MAASPDCQTEEIEGSNGSEDTSLVFSDLPSMSARCLGAVDGPVANAAGSRIDTWNFPSIL